MFIFFFFFCLFEGADALRLCSHDEPVKSYRVQTTYLLAADLEYSHTFKAFGLALGVECLDRP